MDSEVTIGRRLVRLGVGLITLLPLWVLGGFLGARYATSTRHEPLEPRDKLFGYDLERVRTTADDGIDVAGWLLRRHGSRCVILMPGQWEHRDAMIKRSETYVEIEWSVLLVDPRGTGESGGDRCTFGWLERKDLLGWARWLEKEGFDQIGLHGVGAGAAAIAYAHRERGKWEFAVFEQCYDEFEHLLRNTWPWLPAPTIALGPLLMFARQRVGAGLKDLRPLEFMKLVTCPSLFLGGDGDTRTKPDEIRALFGRCVSTGKKMHIFPEAEHEDLRLKFGEQYKGLVRDFVNER
jgi:hypothetical protein